MVSKRIVGVNFNMDDPGAKDLWKLAFGDAIPFQDVYSGKRRLSRMESQQLFDVSIQPVEKHITGTGAQLNEDQRMAVMAHMTAPEHDRGFPWDAHQTRSSQSPDIGTALAAGDSHGIIYHILYNNFVAPALHKAEKQVTTSAEKAVTAGKSFIKNLPFGIGSDAAPTPKAPAVTSSDPVDAETNRVLSSAGRDPSTGQRLALGSGALTTTNLSGVDTRMIAAADYAAQVTGERYYAPSSQGGTRTAAQAEANDKAGIGVTHSQHIPDANGVGHAMDIMTKDAKGNPVYVSAAFTAAMQDYAAKNGFTIRSGNTPNFVHGKPDPVHFDMGLTPDRSGAGFTIPAPTAGAAVGSAAAYSRAVDFVGASAVASALPSFASYQLGHVMIGSDHLRESILGGAAELGVKPVDLATVISFETAGTLDPNQKGPVTQWGQMRGLIQWGEPQRVKYGIGDKTGITVDIPTQMKAVVQYLKDNGVKPGMGLANIEAAINAGNADHIYAMDRGTTVLEKINRMAPNVAQAQRLLGDSVPEEAKIASVVTGAGISADQMFKGPGTPDAKLASVVTGSGNSVAPSYVPTYHPVSRDAMSASVVTGAGRSTPFSTFTYGPGAASIVSSGMSTASVVTGAGMGNSHSTPSGGEHSTGGGPGISGGQHSTPTPSYSGSGNYSNVGEGGSPSSSGGGGGSHSSGAGHSYSGSGNYSNVGEGGSPSNSYSSGVASTNSSGGDY